MKKLLIGSLLCVAGASYAQELVVNGGFEAGTTWPPPGWTSVNQGGFSGINAGGGLPHSGSNSLGMGALSAGDQTNINQMIATTIGQTYVVSFWGYDLDPASAGGFLVTFGGVPVGVRPGALPYQQFSANIVATSASTMLSVTGWEANQWIITDDYSVQQLVPEPASMAVLGLGAVALIRRRKARKA